MRLALVFGVVGRILRPFALAFLPPFLLALRDGLFDPDWAFLLDGEEIKEAVKFAVTGVSTYVAGTLLVAGHDDDARVFRRSEALAVAAATWGLLGVFAAIPYLFAGLSPVDAIFEAISGLTTTGATILGPDMWEQSRAFFLWRAMTQWFGGLGVIALFVVVLPRLGIAGRQIFFAESSSAPGEAVSPSVRRSAAKLWIFYVGLTLLMVALLWWTMDGVTLTSGKSAGIYEATIHSLTTLSAGGFSNDPNSIMGMKDSAAAEWVFIAFMFLAGASYPLMWIAVTRNPLALLRDGEFRLYTLVALSSVTVLAFALAGDIPGVEHIRNAAFQTTSLISSAGFASDDFNKWDPGLKALLVVVMILGGCAGSAAGGAKEVRFLLVFKFIRREFSRVLHPRAVIPIRHGGERVDASVMRAIFLLVLLYLLGYVVVAIPVAVFGADPATSTHIDLETSASAAVACLSNVGPAFGPAGPMGTYQDFHVLSKLWLTFAMLIGRLEIVTVLALFQWEVLKDIRWSAAAPRRSRLR